MRLSLSLRLSLCRAELTRWIAGRSREGLRCRDYVPFGRHTETALSGAQVDSRNFFGLTEFLLCSRELENLTHPRSGRGTFHLPSMSNCTLGKNDSLTGSGRMGQRLSQKEAGAYYTPDVVVATLLRWAVRSPRDRLIDPSCGDGRFIAGHRNSVGIEQDVRAAGGLWPARRGLHLRPRFFCLGIGNHRAL